MMLTLVV